MIDNHKARGEWKIQLTMQIIFVSFTDANETRKMHTKSDNITLEVLKMKILLMNFLTLFVKDIKKD